MQETATIDQETMQQLTQITDHIQDKELQYFNVLSVKQKTLQKMCTVITEMYTCLHKYICNTVYVGN